MAFDPSVIKNLTPKEWQELIEYASAEMIRAQQTEQQAAALDRGIIVSSIGALDALLGSPDDPPFDPAGTHPATIHGVRKHGPEVLGAHAGIVLDLVLQGLEIVAVNSRAVASVIARTQGG